MTENEIVELLAAFMVLLGGIVAIISAYGIITLPDVYTRSHAGTKSSTLAVLLALTGVFIYFWSAENYISIRLVLGIVFLYLTAPVAGHLICRAAYHSEETKDPEQ
ncbi:Na+/H+ antiporter subunit G [Domibacillus enclensis]|uniref:Multisubunit sodium/proton antiporter, MrpG subunit n=2 Tax=Domibacillus enclensis TaxID=1017273 RepID=A0A1N6SST7_9BACI|nr:Na+/H+ antiporter subunit G [Domibacillus enclensis]OXS79408.1 Na+/H+ antiporter subunit G [Domibacillus enclensis]SIQ44180.1 multisubunit sodium/proton antiporter, MrpG subunit [Domibacillus enclensis]